MRNLITEYLGISISESSDITQIHKHLNAYDITEDSFFFIFKGEVVRAYCSGSEWLCKY